MTITIGLSPEEESQLRELARQNGQELVDYVRHVITEHMVTETVAAHDAGKAKAAFQQFLLLKVAANHVGKALAPFQRQVEESGMTDPELDDLFEEARDEVWREKMAFGNSGT